MVEPQIYKQKQLNYLKITEMQIIKTWQKANFASIDLLQYMSLKGQITNLIMMSQD